MSAEESREITTESSQGRNRFSIGTWLFLRLLAIVHLIAFVSFWAQLDGLVGPHGLLPATRYFTAVREQLGSGAYAQLPSLCWWFGTEGFLHVLCASGVILSLLLFAGVAPAGCLALLWAAYLSLNCAGQIFFNFQWDALLLETTLVATFVAPWRALPWWQPHAPPRIGWLLVAWLLFRLMFLSGVVKLASGDPTWRDFTALTFHYETQPLPTPLGWFAHQLPAWWHRASCGATFAVELVIPFFIFFPRVLRHIAASIMIALMIAVALTGNYTFFNLLTIALCVACFDDAWWKKLPCGRTWFCRLTGDKPPPVSAPSRVFTVASAVVIFAFTGLQALTSMLPAARAFPGFQAATHVFGPFRSMNNYGLFAVMTNPRPELIFEGSDDGREWRGYEFPHKPGVLTRPPTWVAPHQPRLDWQLWFAALGEPDQNPWVLALCEHLLHGTPEVLALLRDNPFAGKPPRFVRVVRYEYHFTDFATRKRTGQWWHRTPMDFYVPSVSLR